MRARDLYEEQLNALQEEGYIEPEWKVVFEGGFWETDRRKKAGEEIAVGSFFDWAGHHWKVPAVYLCSRGLVMDLCMQVSREEVYAFAGKWKLDADHDDCECFTDEQQMEIALDNPLSREFRMQLQVNGRKLDFSQMSAVTYNPCFPDRMFCDLDALWPMEHYDLNPDCAWVIYRATFPWAGKKSKVTEIKSPELTMIPESMQLPGPRFAVNGKGDTFSFIHPISRKKYTLTAISLEQQETPENLFPEMEMEFPRYYRVMEYTITPEPDEADQIQVYDLDGGDRTRPKRKSVGEEGGFARDGGCAAIGIIGGADGPTAVFVAGKSRENRADGDGKLQMACSSLHFEKQEDAIQWGIRFEVKPYQEGHFTL